MIQNAGVTDVFDNGLLSAIPYVAAIFFMMWLGRNSDLTSARHAHIAICAWVGAISLATGTSATTSSWP